MSGKLVRTLEVVNGQVSLKGTDDDDDHSVALFRRAHGFTDVLQRHHGDADVLAASTACLSSMATNPIRHA